MTRRLLGRRPRGAARRLRTVLPLLPRASRAGTAALLVEVVTAGLLPVVLALATGSVVASVAGEDTSALPGVDSPWVALAIVATAFAVLQVGLPFLAPAREGLAHRLDLLVRRRVMAALLRPATLAHLEDPKLADEVRLARTVATDMPDTDRTLWALTSIGSARLMAAASGLVLIAYRWWAPLVIAGAWVPLPWVAPPGDGVPRRVVRAVDGGVPPGPVRERAGVGRAGGEGGAPLRPRRLAHRPLPPPL